MKTEEILRHIKLNNKLKTKIKIMAAVFIAFILFSGGLLIWGGIRASQYLASIPTQPIVADQFQEFGLKIQNAYSYINTSCFENAQNMLNVQTWLGRSFTENLNDLKAACIVNSEPTKEI